MLDEKANKEAAAPPIADLFDQMDKAITLDPSPHSSPARAHDRGRHDSDDDMGKEEERLLDSSDKLRRLMSAEEELQESPYFDAELLDDVQRDLFGEAPPPSSTAAAATPSQMHYWDPKDAAGTPPRTPTADAFETPRAVEEDDEQAIWGLCRSASAFLPTASPLHSNDDNDEDEDEQGQQEGVVALDTATEQPTTVDKGIAAVLSATSPPKPKPRNEEDKDMHEVGCAAERLSELSIQQRFCGLRGIAAGGETASLGGGGAEPSLASAASGSALCRHLALFTLRLDVPCADITSLLFDVVHEQGLEVTKRQGSHLVANVPAGTQQAEWRSIDLQLAVDRHSHDRVLLVRFIMVGPDQSSGRTTPTRSDLHRPATRRFLHALKTRVFDAAYNKRALRRRNKESNRGCKAFKLDPQYLTQLEDLAREDMNKTLEANARQLEDYVRGIEGKCKLLKELMEPMFQLYKLEVPPLDKPLPLSFYPLDLSGACAEKGGGKEVQAKIGTEEDGPHDECVDRMACMDALKNKAWRTYVAQCDAEMTARMQRKNLQVMDRMSKESDYVCSLLKHCGIIASACRSPCFGPLKQHPRRRARKQAARKTTTWRRPCTTAGASLGAGPLPYSSRTAT